RALIARDADNLLMAGRCFSADQLALSSARVMPTCAMMGQAAGITLGTLEQFPIPHAWHRIPAAAPAAFASHPESFALVDGERRPPPVLRDATCRPTGRRSPRRASPPAPS
ncbi:MAG: FAD-dependent oxidoreductase, partial [Lentisphaerae bacterium]|nr:FAD-dependent oxidoreductase [Lentisphaerota bacterium]